MDPQDLCYALAFKQSLGDTPFSVPHLQGFPCFYKGRSPGLSAFKSEPLAPVLLFLPMNTAQQVQLSKIFVPHVFPSSGINAAQKIVAATLCSLLKQSRVH